MATDPYTTRSLQSFLDAVARFQKAPLTNDYKALLNPLSGVLTRYKMFNPEFLTPDQLRRAHDGLQAALSRLGEIIRHYQANDPTYHGSLEAGIHLFEAERLPGEIRVLAWRMSRSH